MDTCLGMFSPFANFKGAQLSLEIGAGKYLISLWHSSVLTWENDLAQTFGLPSNLIVKVCEFCIVSFITGLMMQESLQVSEFTLKFEVLLKFEVGRNLVGKF